MSEPKRDQPEEKDVDIRIDSLTHELRQLALRDPLTGLLNRRGFDEELRRIWAQSQSNPYPIGLLILDIDHFKAINDSYGHVVGDQVLKESAQLIRASVRESDIVCRYYGGDEMVVILPWSPAENTRKVAERMVATFQAQTLCKGTHDLHVTISVGVCSMQADPGQSSDRFLMQADRALYRAKQTGRNRVCFADEMNTPFQAQADHPVPAAPAGMADNRRVALLVDDDPGVCVLFWEMLSRENYGVYVAQTGAAALEILKRERGMVDVALVDLLLHNENGLDVLSQMREIDETLIGVIVTGQATLENAISSLRTGAFDFVQKPVAPMQLFAVMERAIKYRQLLLENKRYQHHLEEMVREKNSTLERALEHVNDSYQFTLEAMAEMLDMREQQTGEHSKRVARIATVLAREMGVNAPEELDTIQTGALLHDIGKIGIPDAILLKKGPLTPEEREIMKRHSHIGYNIIKAGPGLEEASEIVLAHQERYDGTGYPRGLKGDAICLGARIFAVVDAYDAIRSDRPYSKGRSAREALDEIVRHKGTQFDPAVVAGLQRCWAELENVGHWPDSASAAATSPGATA